MNNRIYYSEEAEQRAKRERTLAIVIFTAFGLGVGTALALLFAPGKGEETRRSISETMSEGVERSNEAIRRLEKDVAELRKRVEDRVN